MWRIRGWPRLRQWAQCSGFRTKLESRNWVALDEDSPVWVLVEELPKSNSGRDVLTNRSKIDMARNIEIPGEATQKVIDGPIPAGNEINSSSSFVNAANVETPWMQCDLTPNTDALNDGRGVGKYVEVALFDDDCPGASESSIPHVIDDLYDIRGPVEEILEALEEDKECMRCSNCIPNLP